MRGPLYNRGYNLPLIYDCKSQSPALVIVHWSGSADHCTVTVVYDVSPHRTTEPILPQWKLSTGASCPFQLRWFQLTGPIKWIKKSALWIKRAVYQVEASLLSSRLLLNSNELGQKRRLPSAFRQSCRLSLCVLLVMAPNWASGSARWVWISSAISSAGLCLHCSRCFVILTQLSALFLRSLKRNFVSKVTQTAKRSPSPASVSSRLKQVVLSLLVACGFVWKQAAHSARKKAELVVIINFVFSGSVDCVVITLGSHLVHTGIASDPLCSFREIARNGLSVLEY